MSCSVTPALAFELSPSVASGLSLLPNLAAHHQHPHLHQCADPGLLLPTVLFLEQIPTTPRVHPGAARCAGLRRGKPRPGQLREGSSDHEESLFFPNHPSCAPWSLKERGADLVAPGPPQLRARWRPGGRPWARPPIPRALLVLDPNRPCWGNSPGPCAQYCGPCPKARPRLERAAGCPG